MRGKIRNKVKRDVAKAFQVVMPGSLVSLAREFVLESQESAEFLRNHYRERRQCTGTTKAGKHCRAWALLNCAEQLCAAHFYRRRGPVLSHDERSAREKQRTRPTCSCLAYPFPHRPNNGFCRWPEDPIEIHPFPVGTRSPGKLRRRESKAIRKKLGI